MITNVLDIIGAERMDAGTGMTKQQPDGSYIAVIALDEGMGLFAQGANEAVALKALEAKIRALGALCAAAHAQAEMGYQLKKKEEAEEMMGALRSMFGGGDGAGPFGGPAKKDPTGGN